MPLKLSNIPEFIMIKFCDKITKWLICTCYVCIALAWAVASYILNSGWLFNWTQTQFGIFVLIVWVIYIVFITLVVITHCSNIPKQILLYYCNKRQYTTKNDVYVLFYKGDSDEKI